MLWVGGGGILHGLEEYGLAALGHAVHAAAAAVSHGLPAAAGAFGLAVGAAAIPLVWWVALPALARLRGNAARSTAASGDEGA